MLISNHWFHAVFYTTIISQKRKILEKSNQKNFYLRVDYNSFVYVKIIFAYCCVWSSM